MLAAHISGQLYIYEYRVISLLMPCIDAVATVLSMLLDRRDLRCNSAYQHIQSYRGGASLASIAQAETLDLHTLKHAPRPVFLFLGHNTAHSSAAVYCNVLVTIHTTLPCCY